VAERLGAAWEVAFPIHGADGRGSQEDDDERGRREPRSRRTGFRASCLWQISERGSVPYSEVYLDAIQNAARSRSWFRVPAGAQ